jgi:hypothetical protein
MTVQAEHIKMNTQQSFAVEMDSKDPLRKFRDRFIIPAKMAKRKSTSSGTRSAFNPKQPAIILTAFLLTGRNMVWKVFSAAKIRG